MKPVIIKCVLDKRYEKDDGTHPVKLRVYCKNTQKQKYFSVDHNYTEADWKALKGKKIPTRLERSADEIEQIENEAKEIAKSLPYFDFDLFECKFFERSKPSTLANAFNSYINTLTGDHVRTVKNYECARESFESFQSNTLLSQVTAPFLEKYDSWMEEKGRTETTRSMYLRCLRAVILKAINDGSFKKADYPFYSRAEKKKFRIPQPQKLSGLSGTKRRLTSRELELIESYTGEHEKARDFFIFSLYGYGMNLIDICNLRYRDIKEGLSRIEYKRKKTCNTSGESVTIKINYSQELRDIIAKYGVSGSGDDYVFPILEKGISAEREIQLVSQFIHVVNNGMKRLCKEIGIEPLTTYAARRSFASLQNAKGIPLSDLKKMMGHKSLSTTEHYLSEPDDAQLESATDNIRNYSKLVAITPIIKKEVS